MQKALDVKTAEEVYEIVVEKIYQIPSALVARDWKKVNVEFLEFVSEVGMDPLFKEPLLVLNSILLFGIAEDYELGYLLAAPIYEDIKNRKGFNSVSELKLFTRVSFLLCRNFEDLKELSKYAFDFLEASENNFIYEKTTLAFNIMYAIVKMNQKDSLKYEDEIKNLFEKLYSMVLSMGEKYHLEFYIDQIDDFYEEFKSGKKPSEEVIMKELEERYESYATGLNKHSTKFHSEYEVKSLSSIFKQLKLDLGGNL